MKESSELEKSDNEAVEQSRWALLRLFAVIAAIVAVSLAAGVAKTVFVVFIVIAMVMVHELGHFLTAKWAGMKVTEYFVGFGPRLWSIRRGETEYGIKAIPAGGYVRIIGMSNIEEVDEEDEPRTYRQKPYWRRMSVALAGSFMHFVMAYLILVALQAGVGLYVMSNEIGGVSRGVNSPTPAEAAGLLPGDKIVALDGNNVDDWADDVPPYIESRIGVPIVMGIERDGRAMQVTVTPIDGNTLLPPGQAASEPVGKIGITPAVKVEKTNLLVALGRSAEQVGSASVDVLKEIGHIFSPTGIRTYFELLAGSSEGDDEPAASTSGAPVIDDSDRRFVSPVGFVELASGAADAGVRQVMVLLFGFNLFIGIFNLIPLLPFDGGHAAVATYEKLRSRSGKRHTVDFAKLLPVSYAVVVTLVFIGLSSLWLDIFNPITNPYE